jgi:hypothetical protein
MVLLSSRKNRKRKQANNHFPFFSFLLCNVARACILPYFSPAHSFSVSKIDIMGVVIVCRYRMIATNNEIEASNNQSQLFCSLDTILDISLKIKSDSLFDNFFLSIPIINKTLSCMANAPMHKLSKLPII